MPLKLVDQVLFLAGSYWRLVTQDMRPAQFCASCW